MKDIQKESETVSEINGESLINEIRKTVVVFSGKKEEEINRNKPWRIVIRRNVTNVGGSDKDILGNEEYN